jgi:hypothetical protein
MYFLQSRDQRDKKQPVSADVSSVSRLLDGVSYFDMSDMHDDEVELSLSYLEFEQLYNASMISGDQKRRGRVPRKDLPKIQVPNKRGALVLARAF